MADKVQIEKSCPECGPTARLVIKTNRQTGDQFLGCPHWPRCTYTEPVPLSLKLRLAGAPTLPGLE